MRAVLSELASAAAEAGVRAMDYCMLGREEPALPRLLDLTLSIFKTRVGKDGKKTPECECWPSLDELQLQIIRKISVVWLHPHHMQLYGSGLL